MAEERPGRWFQVERAAEAAVVTFTHTDLGEEVARLVGGQMLALLESGGPPRFVLDFGRVQRLSSAMLGKLIAFNRKVSQAGGEVALCSLSPALAEKFRSTRLDRFFRILPAPAAAVAAAAGADEAGGKTLPPE